MPIGGKCQWQVPIFASIGKFRLAGLLKVSDVFAVSKKLGINRDYQ